MEHVYFIKFSNMRLPERYSFKHYDEMFDYIKKLMLDSTLRLGHIEWMIRE